MNRRTMVIVAAAVMLVSSAVLAAAAGPGFGFGGRGDRQGRNIDRMAAVLELTDAQKEKVSAIWKAEQEKTEPLRQQLFENREQMRKITLSEKFDEAKIRELAAKQSQIKTEMMVSHAKAKSEMQALLTPEQRTLAQKLGPMMGPGQGRMQRCWDNE